MADVKHIKAQFVYAVQNKHSKLAVELAFKVENQIDALLISIDNNATEVAEELLRRGWNANETRTGSLSNALHAAVTARNSEIIDTLVRHGTQVNAVDRRGCTPLYKCLSMKMGVKRLKVYEALMRYIGDIHTQDNESRSESVLHIMARNRSVPYYVFKEILEKGVDVNRGDRYTGHTFYMDMIIFFGGDAISTCEQVGKLAWEHGLRINGTDFYGNSVLHRAASEERVKICNWLAELPGVSIEKKNHLQWSPMFYAVKRNNIQVAKILYKMGHGFQGTAYEHCNAESKISWMR